MKDRLSKSWVSFCVMSQALAVLRLWYKDPKVKEKAKKTCIFCFKNQEIRRSYSCLNRFKITKNCPG